MVFHTALDCCKGGLNDQWRDALGMTNTRHFDKNLGWYGHITPTTLDQLVSNIESWLGHKVQGQVFGTGDDVIKSVAVCSGLGGLVNKQALKTKVDCYIVGEAVAPAEQSGFKFYIETGHTISERMGYNVIREALTPHGIQVDMLPLEFEGWQREVYKKPEYKVNASFHMPEYPSGPVAWEAKTGVIHNESDEDEVFECEKCGVTYPIDSHLSDNGVWCVICDEEEDDDER
jgi:hypothetical protein